MKRFVLILFIVLSYNTINAQVSSYDRITYVSPDKDTLILPDNEIGKIFLRVWKETDNYKTQPIIILAPEETIRVKNYYYFVNQEKKKKTPFQAQTSN